MEADLSCVPPGFRFHPTEEELVGYYLTRKVKSQSIDLRAITDIDLYKIEPWDLHARCKLGYEEQTEWYFFSHKDKKYPTGTRTNRATAAGFWKATGRDKVVFSKDRIIGMRKTLVFYRGRAPNGRKTEWVIHEYRLQTSEYGPPQEEGWVVCKAFRKQSPYSQRPSYRCCSSPAYLQDKSNFVYQAPIKDALCYPNEALNFDDHGRATDFDQYKEAAKTMQVCPQLCSLPLPASSNSRDSLLQTRNAATDEEMFDLEPGFIDWKMLDSLLTTQLRESDIGRPSDFSPFS